MEKTKGHVGLIRHSFSNNVFLFLIIRESERQVDSSKWELEVSD